MEVAEAPGHKGRAVLCGPLGPGRLTRRGVSRLSGLRGSGRPRRTTISLTTGRPLGALRAVCQALGDNIFRILTEIGNAQAGPSGQPRLNIILQYPREPQFSAVARASTRTAVITSYGTAVVQRRISCHSPGLWSTGLSSEAGLILSFAVSSMGVPSWQRSARMRTGSQDTMPQLSSPRQPCWGDGCGCLPVARAARLGLRWSSGRAAAAMSHFIVSSTR